MDEQTARCMAAEFIFRPDSHEALIHWVAYVWDDTRKYTTEAERRCRALAQLITGIERPLLERIKELEETMELAILSQLGGPCGGQDREENKKTLPKRLLAGISELCAKVARYRSAQYGMTHDDVIKACSNVGVDLSCGACAGVFYTGAALGNHTCKERG